jgi:hypothetical protein
VRVTGENGRVSEPVARTLVADSVAPSAQISPTLVLSGSLPFLRGVTWDTFPDARPPERVEISIDGGRFRPAIVSRDGESRSNASLGAGAVTASAEWLFPLPLTGADGETIEVVARAVDEAGNVGASSDPVSIVVDRTGPSITGTTADHMLQGTVTDGSGVASLEVSLDGGGRYQPLTFTAGNWSFDLLDWAGTSSLDFAILRARDVWGNMDHAFIVTDTGGFMKIYMPLIMRGFGGLVRNDQGGD